MKKTHVVQSHRGLIERMFARLKKWDVLKGGLVDEVAFKEMELDCAMALQNLNEMDRLGLMRLIPERPHFAPGSHIITSDLEPSMKYPAGLALDSDKVPAHLRRFHSAMSDIAPELRKAIVGVRGKNIFTERTRKRGENLFKGGNVLQVLVEEQPLDNWLVRFTVGASMKTSVYNNYCVLNKSEGVVQQICECKNG